MKRQAHPKSHRIIIRGRMDTLESHLEDKLLRTTSESSFDSGMLDVLRAEDTPRNQQEQSKMYMKGIRSIDKQRPKFIGGIPTFSLGPSPFQQLASRDGSWSSHPLGCGAHVFENGAYRLQKCHHRCLRAVTENVHDGHVELAEQNTPVAGAMANGDGSITKDVGGIHFPGPGSGGSTGNAIDAKWRITCRAIHSLHIFTRVVSEEYTCAQL